MDRWQGKVALVTGATSGIGKATAKKLLESGMKVVGCARKKKTFPKVQDELGSLGELTLISCNIDKDEDVAAMFERIKEKYGGVDVCINNAGVGPDSTILTGKIRDWEKTFNVNVIGLMIVTKAAVESMKAKGSTEGHIINISSSAGHSVPNIPQIHVYSASKFAVTAITAGLRLEVEDLRPGLNCRVSQISPSRVQTPMHEGMKFKIKILDDTDVADTVIYQLSLPPHAQVHDVHLVPTAQPLAF